LARTDLSLIGKGLSVAASRTRFAGTASAAGSGGSVMPAQDILAVVTAAAEGEPSPGPEIALIAKAVKSDKPKMDCP
jgi:hypothetical protein